MCGGPNAAAANQFIFSFSFSRGLDSGNRDAAAASAKENFFASSSIDKIKLKNRDRSTQNT